MEPPGPSQRSSPSAQESSHSSSGATTPGQSREPEENGAGAGGERTSSRRTPPDPRARPRTWEVNGRTSRPGTRARSRSRCRAGWASPTCSRWD
ncbi:hypothetical protein C5C42_17160, partial [Rathayibacter sp. AY1F7]